MTARLAIGAAIVAVSIGAGMMLLWMEHHPPLAQVCAEAANEPAPETSAGRQAAFEVMFACRYGSQQSWARAKAHDRLEEWRRAESLARPKEHSAADLIERKIYPGASVTE